MHESWRKLIETSEKRKTDMKTQTSSTSSILPPKITQYRLQTPTTTKMTKRTAKMLTKITEPTTTTTTNPPSTTTIDITVPVTTTTSIKPKTTQAFTNPPIKIPTKSPETITTEDPTETPMVELKRQTTSITKYSYTRHDNNMLKVDPTNNYLNEFKQNPSLFVTKKSIIEPTAQKTTLKQITTTTTHASKPPAKKIESPANPYKSYLAYIAQVNKENKMNAIGSDKPITTVQVIFPRFEQQTTAATTYQPRHDHTKNHSNKFNKVDNSKTHKQPNARPSIHHRHNSHDTVHITASMPKVELSQKQRLQTKSPLAGLVWKLIERNGTPAPKRLTTPTTTRKQPTTAATTMISTMPTTITIPTTTYPSTDKLMISLEKTTAIYNPPDTVNKKKDPFMPFDYFRLRGKTTRSNNDSLKRKTTKIPGGVDLFWKWIRPNTEKPETRTAAILFTKAFTPTVLTYSTHTSTIPTSGAPRFRGDTMVATDLMTQSTGNTYSERRHHTPYRVLNSNMYATRPTIGSPPRPGPMGVHSHATHRAAVSLHGTFPTAASPYVTRPTFEEVKSNHISTMEKSNRNRQNRERNFIERNTPEPNMNDLASDIVISKKELKSTTSKQINKTDMNKYEASTNRPHEEQVYDSMFHSAFDKVLGNYVSDEKMDDIIKKLIEEMDRNMKAQYVDEDINFEQKDGTSEIESSIEADYNKERSIKSEDNEGSSNGNDDDEERSINNKNDKEDSIDGHENDKMTIDEEATIKEITKKTITTERTLTETYTTTPITETLTEAITKVASVSEVAIKASTDTMTIETAKETTMQTTTEAPLLETTKETMVQTTKEAPLLETTKETTVQTTTEAPLTETTTKTTMDTTTKAPMTETTKEATTEKPMTKTTKETTIETTTEEPLLETLKEATMIETTTQEPTIEASTAKSTMLRESKEEITVQRTTVKVEPATAESTAYPAIERDLDKEQGTTENTEDTRKQNTTVPSNEQTSSNKTADYSQNNIELSDVATEIYIEDYEDVYVAPNEDFGIEIDVELFPGFAMPNGVFIESAKSVQECLEKCYKSTTCESFDFSIHSNFCWFHFDFLSDGTCTPLPKDSSIVHYKLLPCAELPLEIGKVFTVMLNIDK
ncbi:unnamed protein product [Owenia fusiformis]|uniref:Apple domain-containing protein n=1 Tax=Owenia fusiformis TaxID=6347 RepID=A0A8S4PW12_OWEFU|nr:unnamed protein product [Owenia fusiformis]